MLELFLPLSASSGCLLSHLQTSFSAQYWNISRHGSTSWRARSSPVGSLWAVTYQPGHHFSFSASPEGWRENRAGKNFLRPGYQPFHPMAWLVPGVKPLPCCFSLRKSQQLEPISQDSLEQQAKKNHAAEEQTHGKRGREAGGRLSTQAVASREGLASTRGYLRGGPTQGEACPCQECPHFIYSPSLT